MSTVLPLSCASKSLNRPAGKQYHLNSCACKFQPKAAGTYTSLGFSFSTCQAPTNRFGACCGKSSHCVDVKRRRLQGYTHDLQAIIDPNSRVTQGAAIGKKGADALVAALESLCTGVDTIADSTTAALLAKLSA